MFNDGRELMCTRHFHCRWIVSGARTNSCRIFPCCTRHFFSMRIKIFFDTEENIPRGSRKCCIFSSLLRLHSNLIWWLNAIASLLSTDNKSPVETCGNFFTYAWAPSAREDAIFYKMWMPWSPSVHESFLVDEPSSRHVLECLISPRDVLRA